MNEEGGTEKAVCILGLDSGGPGTYSQLLLINECMSRLAADLGQSQDDIYPADYFDLMGGTGFGGLAAILLGHLRMNVEQAIDALLTLAYAVFPDDTQPKIDLEVNSKSLREAVEYLLRTRDVPLDTKMNDQRRPSTECKVVIYAATSSNISHPRVFRTYPSRGSSLNPTIVEAICATMSFPSLFSPTRIGPLLRQQLFVGSPIRTNNPTRELLKEAGIVFGKDRRVSQILSLGSGMARVLSLDSSERITNTEKLLREMGADCETVAKEMSSRLFNLDAYLRLNVERGMEGLSMTDWRDMGAIESHTSTYVETTLVAAALENTLRKLRNRVGSVTLGQINHTSGIKVTAKRAPAVSPYYVKRLKESDLMDHHLVTASTSRQRIFPITGMGGCGKTQLVSYFLQEHPSLYTHAVFVDASSRSNIQSDLETWSRSLGDGHEHDSWEGGLVALSTLPESTHSALILDNADDPALNLVPFIPQNKNLTVIITSRNRHVGSLSTTCHLELGQMGTAEGLSTLLHAAKRQPPLPNEDLESAHVILKELGCLAVALVQVGTYCNELSSSVAGVLHPYTFTQYLALFRSHSAELMKRRGPSSLDSYERAVYTTLDLSYGALPAPARDFLHFISFFHHSGIPLSALAAAAGKSFKDPWSYSPRPGDHQDIIANLRSLLCADGEWSELQVHEIIRTLSSFSLLSATSIDDSLFLEMHPLIQKWSRDMITVSCQRYSAMVVQIVATCCTGLDNFDFYRYLLPHVFEILDQQEGNISHVNDHILVGQLLHDQGYFKHAAALFETALNNMKNSIEWSEENQITLSSWLASAYMRCGRLNKAEMLEVDVLERRNRNFGKEHPQTIHAAANLAATYRCQGRWSEAELLEVDVLEQRGRTLGSGHPDTISAATNLASTYRYQGRWRDAELLEVDVLEQQCSTLGSEHLETILARAHLAVTYRHQGRWSDAESLQVRVLEQQRRALGGEHMDTVLAAANLAATYRFQGRWNEAELLQADVLEQQPRILGRESLYTISAAANLATIYRDQGRWSEAEKLEIEVLELRRRILGRDNPDTIWAVSNLALTYQEQGRWGEAEEMEIEVLELRRKILGLEHPDTILAAMNLATTYRLQGRSSEAEQLEIKGLEQCRRIFGMEHPYTISAAANLAATYDTQGRWEEAALLLAPTVQLGVKVMGRHHPKTQLYVKNLELVYEKLGKETEAQEMRDLLVTEPSNHLP